LHQHFIVDLRDVVGPEMRVWRMLEAVALVDIDAEHQPPPPNGAENVQGDRVRDVAVLADALTPGKGLKVWCLEFMGWDSGLRVEGAHSLVLTIWPWCKTWLRV
jgi:hypothetical protein